MRTLTIITLLTIVTIAKSQIITNLDPTAHKLVNQAAPHFKAVTLDGKEFSLSDSKGKVVLLDFWSLSCGACFKEIKEFNTMTNKYSKDKFVLISIMDNTALELLEKFEIVADGYKMKKTLYGNDKITFQIIPDGKEIMKMYTDQLIYPRAFIIDQNGTVTYHLEGYAEEHGIPGEITTKELLNKEIDRLLSASR